MKTLYEGILDDMEDVLDAGDKFDKQYKKMTVEIENMHKICSAVKNNNWVHDTYRFDPRRYPNIYHQGISERYYNIIDCPKIFKHYGSTYKSLIIKLVFTPGTKDWVVEIGATRQTTKNWDVHKSAKQSVMYRFIESKYIPGPGNGPLTPPDKLLQEHVMPLISDIDTLYKNIIKPIVTTRLTAIFKGVANI